ncbi:TIGR03618 family F420-dependent PPOX class oxidoreductase [Mycolicibacterium sp. S2-37]|uniref:TIGR03618 family F420-dependent PPOX class oxidoreductase n=1 Tax=Mycolicibacterium sp. S2-37 TaxID=2810297 RepID=UPI0027D9E5F2|nr:TIGR03618 family F420-dependent PPOX class oxidoreductase [Mycolicibacterium sp. S2-37]
MAEQITLTDAFDMARSDKGLASVATARGDGTIQASVVNVGLLAHPTAGEPVLGFVTYGRARKLTFLRARPQVTITFRQGWRWATAEGQAEIAGPDDPQEWLDGERLRLLRREVFVAAGGSHDDWDEYDRVMDAEKRAVVLVRVHRVYGN